MEKNGIVKVIKNLGLTDYQTDKIAREILDILNLNKKFLNTTPDKCPNCLSVDSKFIKKGVNSGKQRYQCKKCLSVFVWDVNQLTYHSKVSRDKWNIVICDTLSLVSLLKTAAKVDLSENTVFRMRHKFLLVLEDLVESNVLSGVIECDETYILESLKGTVTADRKPRKRQTPATKRGLSNEQVCVIVASNRNGTEYARVIDKGKPTSDKITANLKHHIEDKSVMITDKLASYNDIITLKACTHYTLSTHKKYDNLLHLNTVNGIHSKLKEVIRNYRGVATKYLNRYCALLVFLRNFKQMDDNEMMPIILGKLRSSDYYCKSNCLRSSKLVYV